MSNTMVLRKHNLNALGKGKDTNDLTFYDFRVSMMDFYQARKVLYVYKNRVRILKNRID